MKTGWVIITGTWSHGFVVYGPFDNRSLAEDFAAENGRFEGMDYDIVETQSQ